MPAATAAAPAARSVCSGVCAAAASSLRPSCGAAAHSRPSNTNTSPTATSRSLIASAGQPPVAGRVGEILEELAVRRQQHARVRRLHALLVGLHRAVEAEEVRIAVERIGEDAVALGVALAAHALALAGGLGLDDGDLAIGVGADAVGCARAFGAELGRLALALGAHAVEDVLGVLLGQVGALDAHVDHFEAELLALLVDLLGDPLHQRFALVRTRSWKVEPPSTRRSDDSMIGPSRERTMRSSRTV